jgi:hypothetical protein
MVLKLLLMKFGEQTRVFTVVGAKLQVSFLPVMYPVS